MNTGLTLTDNAAAKLAKLKHAEGNDALMLRVYVTGGGCSGLAMGLILPKSLAKMTRLLTMGQRFWSWMP